jgi:hypothetical protein
LEIARQDASGTDLLETLQVADAGSLEVNASENAGQDSSDIDSKETMHIAEASAPDVSASEVVRQNASDTYSLETPQAADASTSTSAKIRVGHDSILESGHADSGTNRNLTTTIEATRNDNSAHSNQADTGQAHVLSTLATGVEMLRHASQSPSAAALLWGLVLIAMLSACACTVLQLSREATRHEKPSTRPEQAADTLCRLGSLSPLSVRSQTVSQAWGPSLQSVPQRHSPLKKVLSETQSSLAVTVARKHSGAPSDKVASRPDMGLGLIVPEDKECVVALPNIALLRPGSDKHNITDKKGVPLFVMQFQTGPASGMRAVLHGPKSPTFSLIIADKSGQRILATCEVTATPANSEQLGLITARDGRHFAWIRRANAQENAAGEPNVLTVASAVGESWKMLIRGALFGQDITVTDEDGRTIGIASATNDATPRGTLECRMLRLGPGAESCLMMLSVLAAECLWSAPNFVT